jgi:hypothetical protein
MSDIKYFNFPVQLLKGFILDHKFCLNNILDYALYEHSLKMEHGDEMEKFLASASFFGVELGNPEAAFNTGETLYLHIPKNSPKVGINLKIFWDFLKNYKCEFQKICLLGHLAMKSILQNKAYCKTTNKYWLSRMDGRVKSRNNEDLSPEIRKYANEYQTKKIKNALVDSWNLITYSYFTRGFYVSYKLTLDDLAYEAELKREKTKTKKRKELTNQARLKANQRLENNT